MWSTAGRICEGTECGVQQGKYVTICDGAECGEQQGEYVTLIKEETKLG
jgi:hypothetical protein